MDEIEEATAKWEARFSGKPYKPKKTIQRKTRVTYNNSRSVAKIHPSDTAITVSQPSAFAHLKEPFFIQIGNEVMQVNVKDVHTRNSVTFSVIRGVIIPAGYHNGGTRVRIVPPEKVIPDEMLIF